MRRGQAVADPSGAPRRRRREIHQVARDGTARQVDHRDLAARGKAVRGGHHQQRRPAGQRAAGDVHPVDPVRDADRVPALLALEGEPSRPPPAGLPCVLGLPGDELALLVSAEPLDPQPLGVDPGFKLTLSSPDRAAARRRRREAGGDGGRGHDGRHETASDQGRERERYRRRDGDNELRNPVKQALFAALCRQPAGGHPIRLGQYRTPRRWSWILVRCRVLPPQVERRHGRPLGTLGTAGTAGGSRAGTSLPNVASLPPGAFTARTNSAGPSESSVRAGTAGHAERAVLGASSPADIALLMPDTTMGASADADADADGVAGRGRVPVRTARPAASDGSSIRWMSRAATRPASSIAAAGDAVVIRTASPAPPPARISVATDGAGSRSAQDIQTSPSPSTPIRRRSAASAVISPQAPAARSAEAAVISAAVRSPMTRPRSISVTRSRVPVARQAASTARAMASSAPMTTSGLRRRSAAWTTCRLVTVTSCADAPTTRAPPAIWDQVSSAIPPVTAATPSAHPSLVTTLPAAISRAASAPRTAAITPGRGGGAVRPPVRSQSSQPITRASAEPVISAMGNCPDSQFPAPANAASGCLRRSIRCPLPR